MTCSASRRAIFSSGSVRANTNRMKNNKLINTAAIVAWTTSSNLVIVFSLLVVSDNALAGANLPHGAIPTRRSLDEFKFLGIVLSNDLNTVLLDELHPSF